MGGEGGEGGEGSNSGVADEEVKAVVAAAEQRVAAAEARAEARAESEASKAKAAAAAAEAAETAAAAAAAAAHGREIEEIRRDHGRQLEAVSISHGRELEEIREALQLRGAELERERAGFVKVVTNLCPILPPTLMPLTPAKTDLWLEKDPPTAPAACYRPMAMGCGLWAAGYGLWARKERHRGVGADAEASVGTGAPARGFRCPAACPQITPLSPKLFLSSFRRDAMCRELEAEIDARAAEIEARSGEAEAMEEAMLRMRREVEVEAAEAARLRGDHPRLLSEAVEAGTGAEARPSEGGEIEEIRRAALQLRGDNQRLQAEVEARSSELAEMEERSSEIEARSSELEAIRGAALQLRGDNQRLLEEMEAHRDDNQRLLDESEQHAGYEAEAEARLAEMEAQLAAARAEADGAELRQATLLAAQGVLAQEHGELQALSAVSK